MYAHTHPRSCAGFIQFTTLGKQRKMKREEALIETSDFDKPLKSYQ
jgi:hypothetical protein